MLISQRPFNRLLLPIIFLGITVFSGEALGQKISERVSYAMPTLSMSASPMVVTTCPGEVATTSSRVQLYADAKSPSGNSIRYSWRANGGRITGEGPTVTWDLSGLSPGYYKAFVEIDTAADEEECEAFASTTVLVRCPPPVCPNVAIACPEQIAVDQPLTFRSTITGGTANVRPEYNWTVSAGRIIEGQGTNSITVDTTGLAGQTVTASLSMDGYNLDCSAVCSVGIPIPIPPSRKFDEFPDIARNDEKARLDNYAIELQNDPTATAYVIVYPGQRSRTGDVQRHTNRIVEYLVNTRGIDGGRIMTITGPQRNELFIELWLTPQGAVAPIPGR